MPISHYSIWLGRPVNKVTFCVLLILSRIMSSLHIRRGSQVIICRKVSTEKYDRGITRYYKLPQNIGEGFLRSNCLYINVDGPHTVNRVCLFTFKGVSIEQLDDGSKFMVSNSGIPFVYDNRVGVELSKRRHDKDTVHILLDPSREEKTEIKKQVDRKIKFRRIINYIEKVLVTIILLFLFTGILFCIYYFRNYEFPILKSAYKIVF